MKKGDVLKLVVSISLCLSAGILGSLFTRPNIPTWYAGLAKPAFTPPDWVFAPAWSVLYIMMGVSCFLVWRKGLKHPGTTIALVLFALQLFFNALWSYLFFTLRSPIAGMLDIIAIWILILFTIMAFLRVSMTAALLLLPYIAWVSYALVLNVYIWRLNP